MRCPITVDVSLYDMAKAEPGINVAVDALAEFLKDEPAGRTSGSKYGLLGSAGKALSELKAGRYERDSLIGYTLRVRESARARQGPGAALSLDALAALERAVDSVLLALREAPEPYHSAILDRIDYGLYYRRRRMQLEEKEAVRRDWVHFLENRHGSTEALSRAWGRSISDFGTLVLPKKRPERSRRMQRSQAEQADVEDFYATLGRPVIAEDENE